MPEFFVGGASLHYEDTGEGEPLLLLHGNGENLHYFDKQIPVFAQRYRVIAMDTRAHGTSTHGEDELRFERLADDAAALLNHLGIKSAHLLGYSDGGNTAMLFAIRHPEMVRSLLLNGANADPSGVKLFWRILTWIGYWLLFLFAQFSESAGYKREIIGLMVNQPRLTSVNLSAIGMPTLLVVGQHDMIRASHSRMLARNIRHAKLLVIPGAGHAVARKKPDTFNKIALDFFQNPMRQTNLETELMQE